MPRLETAAQSADANFYSLLLVALLERREPITLAQAAARFEEAGIAPADAALASLKRCKPGRAPIYRDGDLYALDSHDAETDLWTFRLGLRPREARLLPVVSRDPGPLPSLDEPLTPEALEEAWRDDIPNTWSSQRIAVCVLDAHDTPLRLGDLRAFVEARAPHARLPRDDPRYRRRGAPIRERDDGLWELDRQHAAIRSARQAVRDRIETCRRWADQRPDPELLAAHRERIASERAAHAEQLASMRRVLVHAFPARRPEAVVLLDVEKRRIETRIGDELADIREELASYDSIAAVDVRALLRALDFDPGPCRLAELGPPQKSMRLNRRGRTLKITTTLLIQGSCGIHQPFGDPRFLRGYLRDGQTTGFRRRLEADAKSLFALYQYGRVHGFVRLRWGFLDEPIPAPWDDRDEPTLWNLEQQALERGVPLEIVDGAPPGWKDPWARARKVSVRKERDGWQVWLVDEHGMIVDEGEVQAVRLVEPRSEGP